MSKKSILSIIIILFIIGIGFVGYYFFLNKDVAIAPTSGSPTNPFGDFFPTENTGTVAPTGEVTDVNPFEETITKLRKISDVPVAGSVVFDRKASSTNATATTTETVYRYVERATGHIYEMVTTDLSATRISNTTIPKIYKASFLGNKDQVIYQYLDKNNFVDTYVAEIKENKTETASEEKNVLEGTFMKKNILGLAISPDGKSIFNLVRNAEEKSSFKLLGNVSLATNPNAEKLVFNSYISEWIPEWVGIDTIALNNNASNDAVGYLYLFNIRTSSFNKILGPFNGLASKVSPDLKTILYSIINNGQIELRYLDVTKNFAYIIPTPTLAEKCVWGSDSKNVYCAIPENIYGGQYPDSWYLGESSFNDSLVKINIETQKTSTLLNSGGNTEYFDMTDLHISPKEDFIMFTNKKDLKLWSLEI